MTENPDSRPHEEADDPGDDVSDSDILAPEGRVVKTSHHESSEPGASQSLAHDENEEHEQRIDDLASKPMEWLSERARQSGIPEWNRLSKGDLVKRLSESAAPPH